eukprot:g4899.t1
MQSSTSVSRCRIQTPPSKQNVSNHVLASSVTSSPDKLVCSRRGVASLTGLVFLYSVPDALALLPDDDDLDLVEKAKARRKSRLQKELESERQFVRSEGLRAAEDAKLITSVQKAVFNLAKSGADIDSGELGEVSTLLSDDWIAEFETASKDLSTGVDGGPEGVKSILSGIASLQTAASKGNLADSKKLYIQVVDAMQDWTNRTGIQSKLKGL